MKLSPSRISSAFTLIELLTVIGIIAILSSLVMPQVKSMTDRARSITCMGNLRQIGAAFNEYAADNDGTFPYIEPNADNPVYPPQGFDAQPILERLQPYDITQNSVKCPADVATVNYFASHGSSYQWIPLIDGETQVNPQIFGRRGARTARLSRVRICMDYEAVHFNRANRLYADGHAVAQLKDP